MATAQTVFGTVGAKHTPQYYTDFVRENLYPSLYVRQLGTLVTIPKGSGSTVKIPRWKTPVKTASGQTTISAVAGALPVMYSTATEMTTTITGGRLCGDTNVSGGLYAFAGFRTYNDALIQMNATDFIEGALESLVREMALKVDRHSINNISGSSNLKFVGTTKSGTANTLAAKEIAKMVTIFDAQNVGRFDDDTYVALANPLVQYDLFSELCSNGWNAAVQYGDPDRIYKGEVGKLYGCRIVTSAAMLRILGGTSATNGLCGQATGTQTFFFAPDAFYSLELEGGGLQVIHKALGSAGTADPVNVFGTVGLKLYYGVAAAPSTDYKLIRLGHGVSVRF